MVGGLLGVAATMITGFSQAGWMLGGFAEELAQQRSIAAVTDALAPVCIGPSRADPELAAKLIQFKALTAPYQQREFVMSAGWATVAAADKHNSDLAEACAKALTHLDQI